VKDGSADLVALARVCSTIRAGRGMPLRSWARKCLRRRNTGAALRLICSNLKKR